MRYLISILLVVNLFSNDDLDLVVLAYENGLKPAPNYFESLITELNTDSKDLSKEKIALGKKLFFDKDLSLNKDINCASCHGFDKGGADSRPTAIGHKNQKNPFHLNTPTVLNTAFSKKFFWDGRSDTLQDQAKGPLQAPFEMSITPKLAEKRISQNQEYTTMFIHSFGSSEVTFEKISHAISAYEKTLVTRGRYDDFLVGFFDALNQEEKRGLELFIKKGCVGCHNGIGLGGQVLRKFPLSYHKIWSIAKPIQIKALQKSYKDFLTALVNFNFKNNADKLNYLELRVGKENMALLREGFFQQIDENEVVDVMTSSACTTCHVERSNKVKESVAREVAFPFENRGKFLGSKIQQGYFRVPLLRNVVRTGPYFHNGEVEKLEDAVRIMGRHQARTDLDDSEIDKIIAFLKAVDGEIVTY